MQGAGRVFGVGDAGEAWGLGGDVRAGTPTVAESVVTGWEHRADRAAVWLVRRSNWWCAVAVFCAVMLFDGWGWALFGAFALGAGFGVLAALVDEERP